MKLIRKGLDGYAAFRATRRKWEAVQVPRATIAAMTALTLAGCASLSRNSVPEAQIDLAAPYGIQTYIRDWGDTLSVTGETAGSCRGSG